MESPKKKRKVVSEEEKAAIKAKKDAEKAEKEAEKARKEAKRKAEKEKKEECHVRGGQGKTLLLWGKVMNGVERWEKTNICRTLGAF